MSLSYRNIQIDPEDRELWAETLRTIREIVDRQPGADLTAYVQVFWFSDLTFAIVPVGPNDMTAAEGLTLLKGAALGVMELEGEGVWRKADLGR